jgi:PAS domain-containing protein
VNALRDYHSPLSHFEPTELFDTLSTGIVVLDAQYCPIYANVSAQDFMAVSLRQARGRPPAAGTHRCHATPAHLARQRHPRCASTAAA